MSVATRCSLSIKGLDWLFCVEAQEGRGMGPEEPSGAVTIKDDGDLVDKKKPLKNRDHGVYI